MSGTAPPAPLPRRQPSRVAFAALWILLPATLLALDPTRTVYQYRCSNWSRQNGLPVSSVNAITQTKDGYVWLGTQQGLLRFDGIEFTSFPVSRTPMFVSQNISTLSRSRNGGLWFGLREGAVGYFDGATFSPLPASWVEPNMQVFGVREVSDGSVWVTWNFGYGRWRPNGAPVAESEVSVGTVVYKPSYEDPSGRVWVASVDRSTVYYWENGVRHTFPDESLRSTNVFAIAQDKEGQVWLGTQSGLRLYDAEFRRKDVQDLNSWAQVNALLIDRQGVLWIGTEGDGLIRYHNGKFTPFTNTHGLINDFVSSLYEDTEGNLWVGTRGGVSELSDVKFPLYTVREGLPGEPIGIATANDAVWAATARGLSHITESRITTVPPEAGLPNQYVKRAWQARNGDVYVIDGDRGLSILSDGRLVKRHLLTEWPVALAEDAEGMLVTFAGELCRVDREKVVPFTYKNGTPPPMVWAVNICPARDGSFWLATHRGVWRIKDGEYQQWSTHNGLTGSVANWVFEDVDGTIWAGLATGVARFRDGNVRCIGHTAGLFDNFIFSIVPDTMGWFWIDSGAGIFRVRRQNLNDVADGKTAALECEPFNGIEAVKSNDKHAQEPTTAVTPDGRIWFPTAAGVVAIDPARIPTNSVPPPVYIQRIRVAGRELTGGKVVAPDTGRGDLEFNYTALSFAAPAKIRFRYFLEGYDERWIDAGERRSAFYTNLKPGHYTFSVQACNADGVWNTVGDHVALTLPPRFYQTGWFRALLALCGVAMLAGVYLWRVQALRLRQRTLQQLNSLLDAKVQSRTAELAEANRLLHEEIAERKRFEHEAEKMNQQLIAASREAGMAEVATSVLHNVGNVLNSVNVSVSVMAAHLREAKFDPLTRISRLLAENAAKPGFLTTDEKGQKIPSYIDRLAEHLTEQHHAISRELVSLRKNIEHIKDIVQMQQGYSRLHSHSETVKVAEILEDVLRLSGAGLMHRQIKVTREVDPGLTIVADKPKVLQVLVNLLRNAIHSCTTAGRTDCPILVRAFRTGERIRFQVVDQGEGIAPENMARLFTQGFTTKKDGHGYGLHSSAIAAKAMGGTLSARSDGPGKGATFTLEIPAETGVQAAEAAVRETGTVV